MLSPSEKRGSWLVIVGARVLQEGAVCATDATRARWGDAKGRLPAMSIRTGHLTASVTLTPLQARDEHRFAEETDPLTGPAQGHTRRRGMDSSLIPKPGLVPGTRAASTGQCQLSQESSQLPWRVVTRS